MACETNLLHNSREISGEADTLPQNLILSPPSSSVALLSCSGLENGSMLWRRRKEGVWKKGNLIHDEQLAQRMKTESTGGSHVNCNVFSGVDFSTRKSSFGT